MRAEDVAEGGEELREDRRGVGLGVGSEAADNEAGQAVESRFSEGGRLGRGGRWDEVFGEIGLAGCFGFRFLEIFERLEGLELFSETVDFLQEEVLVGGRVFRRVFRWLGGRRRCSMAASEGMEARRLLFAGAMLRQ